jgi:hypothetical protein
MSPLIRVAALLCLLGVCSLAAPLVDDFVLESVRVVDDPDGYVNVRSDPSLQSKIVARVNSGSVVAVEAALEGGWAMLIAEEDGEPPRYVHGSRLKGVTPWKQMGATPGDDGKEAVFRDGGFEVRVTSVPFEVSGRAVTRDEHGFHLVDGRRPWGQDGGLPKESLVLTAKSNGRKVEIPAVAMRDLFEPNLDSLAVLTPSDPGERALVLMSNSDGAGAYVVIWAFEKGTYRGRVVFSPF